MFVLGSSKDLHSLRGCWRADESGDQDCVYKAFCHRMFPLKEPQLCRTTDTLYPRVAILEPSIVTGQADMCRRIRKASGYLKPLQTLPADHRSPRGRVSTKRGFSDESPSASRILLTAVFRL